MVPVIQGYRQVRVVHVIRTEPVAPTTRIFKTRSLKTVGCSKLKKRLRITDNSGYLVLVKPSLKLSGVDAQYLDATG